MNVEIKIIGPDIDGFAIAVDGEIIMECLSEKEVRALTIGEIADLLAQEI